MKKLIVLIAFITTLAVASYAQLPGFQAKVSGGYASKVLNYGEVAAEGVYTADLELSWQSFIVGVNTFNDLEISPFKAKLNRVDVTGAYKLFSTLADIDVGATYTHENNGPLDFKGHWQPFVTIGKSFYAVTGTYDLQSRLLNFEGKLHKSFDLSVFKVTPVVFGGVTDVNDALPKSVKEIKYNTSYVGGELSLGWKWLNVGGFISRDLQTEENITGWKVLATKTF